MIVHTLLAVLLMLASPFIESLAVAAPNIAVQTLSRAETAFASGRYLEAQKAFKSIAIDSISEADDRARWHILCARINFADDKLAESEKCLRDALKIKPDAAFDPYMDQPPFISMWKSISAEVAAVVTEKPAASTEVAAPTIAPRPVSPFKRSVRAGFSLFPFGIGSFVNDQVMEGAFFATLNLLAFAVPLSESNCCGGLMLITLPGVWGYEWAENIPRFGSEFPRTARVLDRFMPIFPFGAAQLRNGQDRKALTLAATQLAFLGVVAAGLQREEYEWDQYQKEQTIYSRSEVSSSKAESQSGEASNRPSGNGLQNFGLDRLTTTNLQKSFSQAAGYDLIAIGWVGFLSSYAYGLFDGWYYQGDGELKSPQILRKLRLVPAIVNREQSAAIVPQLEIRF